MTGRPETSGAVVTLGEEVAAAPEETCTASRHDGSRAAYQAGCRCAGAVAANRTYYREYNREARELAAWRKRQNEYARNYQRRLRANPDAAKALRAKRRQQSAVRRARARHDALHGIDVVVVQRLTAGETVAHNRVERLEAVQQLRQRGCAYDQIAGLLHVQPRQVHRDMTELGLIERKETVA